MGQTNRELGDLTSQIEVFGKVSTEDAEARGGERALLSALLFDGIQSFINYMCAGTDSEKKRHREAFDWIRSRRVDYIFSFENVCECLGINAEYLRCGLVNAANSQAYEWKKIRRHF